MLYFSHPSFLPSLLLSFQQRLFLAKPLLGSMIPPEKQNTPRYKSFYSGLGVTFKEKQIPYQPESEWKPRTANILGRPNPYRNTGLNHLLETPSVENETELEFCCWQTWIQGSVCTYSRPNSSAWKEHKIRVIAPKRANWELHRFPICFMLPQTLQFPFTNKHNKNLKYVMYLNNAELLTETE